MPEDGGQSGAAPAQSRSPSALPGCRAMPRCGGCDGSGIESHHCRSPKRTWNRLPDWSAGWHRLPDSAPAVTAGVEAEKAEAEKGCAETEKACAETEKACAETEKARAETEEARAETDKACAETEKARAEIQSLAQQLAAAAGPAHGPQRLRAPATKPRRLCRPRVPTSVWPHHVCREHASADANRPPTAELTGQLDNWTSRHA